MFVFGKIDKDATQQSTGKKIIRSKHRQERRRNTDIENDEANVETERQIFL